MSDPPLRINERVYLGVYLGRSLFARFDGETVIIENAPGTTAFLHLTPALMAHLFWFNRRVVDTFPDQWAIDLGKLEAVCPGCQASDGDAHHPHCAYR